MQIGIGKGSRIVDLQKEFSHYYPYLKLEFYRHPSSKNRILQKAEKINPGEYMDRITRSHKAESINIDHKKTVVQLVEDFWKEFGLSVLVFRKSGNLWIETSLTDNWTLDKQNKIGESFSDASDGL
jgi:hypothetical protein